jgi:hypothetical protein
VIERVETTVDGARAAPERVTCLWISRSMRTRAAHADRSGRHLPREPVSADMLLAYSIAAILVIAPSHLNLA